MEQTVIKVGNSLAITIPSGFVKARKLKAGQKIYVNADPYKDMIFVRTTKKGISGITSGLRNGWKRSIEGILKP